ncbi:GFA family protein [Bradyrhizobium erythrophlei]|uniref:GFA family protein n=1 Tax=Bradyrhizobium erythrophlei TaxID=1437360 RepID=UPI0035EAE6C3
MISPKDRISLGEIFLWKTAQSDARGRPHADRKGFESSPGKTRYFCTQCGSHIVAARDGRDTILLRMGCLETPITDRPKMHIWRSECASWFDPKDELPEWPEGAPPKT